MKKNMIVCFILFFVCTGCFFESHLTHIQGEMAGEVTQNSVLLQSRLTYGLSPIAEDVPGSPGFGCFEISKFPDFRNSFTTEPIKAVPETDFIIKTKVTELNPGTRYYYRLLFGENKNLTQAGNRCTFKTWPERTMPEKVTFAVVTGMNYNKFYFGVDSAGNRAYQGEDKHLGYPGLAAILMKKPDFFVGTGDNVYYDVPANNRAQSKAELRKKWHQQFIQPRFIKLFANIPAYWEKDDHDYRFNDCDTTGEKKPSSDLGIKTFVEQVPVVDPQEYNPVTYRTHMINKLLQIWLLEGRDYRSPNSSPDGPNKSLWGVKQKKWLKKTLSESNAVFKILITPTPMIGPDDAYKKDNHTNPNGFRYEGEEFFDWLKANGFVEKNFYIICGDRHWQYHSKNPAGFEEFSCGALIDANSRLGRKPGDPKSTDPEGKIFQYFTQQ